MSTADDLCRCLKTKMLYVAGRESAPLERASSTAQYWCLETMSQVGPDDALVAPDHCRRGRECYRAEE
jgi:hypothetical protein